jgi:glycosyltransferase involved in cell wall biosynthesis
VSATRVLILFPTLAVGGAERQASFLAPGLRDRGFSVHVATLKERGRFYEELRTAGIETTHVDMSSRFDVRGAVRGYRLWRGRPEIVLTQGLDATLVGHAIARRARAAHVSIEQGGSGLARSRDRRLLLGLVAPRVDRVVAVSATQRRELEELGYRSAAIRVVPNGTLEPVPARPADVVRHELGLTSDDVIVLLPAALRPEKRPDLFVEALRRAHDRDPRVKGVLAGGGPLLDDVRRQAATGAGAVLVLGERSDVPDLMRAADVVCLTSDVEGIPLAALEAMALARPLVATAVGGLQEVVQHGRTGLLVPPDDPDAFSAAVLAVAGDRELRARLGSAAVERYRAGYTAESMIDRYAELLSELATPAAAAA